MNKKRPFGLKFAILTRAVFPLVVLGVAMMAFCSQRFSLALQEQAERELKNMVTVLLRALESEKPEAQLAFDGGRVTLEPSALPVKDEALLDIIKQDMNIEVSLFVEDVRVLTTLSGEDGSRLVGTRAHAVIARDVLTGQQEHFYSGVEINGQDYFAYYIPYFNKEGESAGILGVAKPAAEISQAISRAVRPIIYLVLAGVVLTAFLSLSFMKSMVDAIQRITEFLRKLSKGNLDAELEQGILAREDELGDTGRLAVHMQREVRRLVEKDVLTGLDNRMNAENRLQSVHREAGITGSSYALALGDVDNFRQINETYGKEGGDFVLKNIARILNDSITGKGFVARWNGEEFLVVLENMEEREAAQLLEGILTRLRKEEIVFQDKEIQVAMTFGAVTGDGMIEINETLKHAAGKLFSGKECGKDRVVV